MLTHDLSPRMPCYLFQLPELAASGELSHILHFLPKPKAQNVKNKGWIPPYKTVLPEPVLLELLAVFFQLLIWDTSTEGVTSFLDGKSRVYRRFFACVRTKKD
ncbi:hypothetical protein NDU88_002659 [Pleurodeles waltl]|uniref:Uncharacterized protein n=1 Tax=Pleurodeles waltl TaxID=8319 RepID=A0AAV7UY96_PLEWA|nr:hypothetical protein NDU88_002659 [Pleurodeles waltl]